MNRIKQVKESKQLISKAIFRLLRDYSFKEITISQITSEANVGRNTFYRNFRTKEDVILYTFEVLMDDAKSELQNLENPTVRDFIRWRFKILKDNPQLAIYTEQTEIYSIMYKFRKLNRDAFKYFFQGKKPLSFEFNLGGLDYVTDHWIVKGMQESPDEMADSVLKLFSF